MTDRQGSAPPGPGSVLVVMPTYAERDNLEPILARLHGVLPAVHVLVVDDASPDGTGELAKTLASADERVHVLHRTGKAGIGAAYTTGFRWALRAGYDVIVEMDADGSHAPEELPRLLDPLTPEGGGADLVLGSRYVSGGRVVNWPWHRELLSRGGNLYSRCVLGAPVHDITGGFRAYRADVLQRIRLDDVASQGYCFQVDIAWRAIEADAVVVEVPITFVEREWGESKMHGGIVREALLRVTTWGLRHRGGQLLRALRHTYRQ